MDTSTLIDTRDRVVALGVRFDELEKLVAKNSTILKDLHELSIEARGAGRLGRALWDAGKLMFAGGAGAGLMTWAQAHLPRLSVLALATWVALAGGPVQAAQGWILAVEACGQVACLPRPAVNYGGSWACEEALDALIARVPGTAPYLWGFPCEVRVTVKAGCVAAEEA